jgi:hypothetical protein
MSTIIVYKRLQNSAGTGPNQFITLAPEERREGMKDAGQMLRAELALNSGSANDTDAEDRVTDVLDRLIAEKVGTLQTYDVRLEKDRINPVKYKIDGRRDKKGRYRLTHPDNLLSNDPNNAPKDDSQLTPQDKMKNGALRMDVGLDHAISAKNIFRMRMTVPRAAGNITSWNYLTDDINADVNQIEADPLNPVTKAQNYLISTFMFSRCR